MSTEVKSSKGKALRKATFTVKGKGDSRVYSAVNKRAHKWAKKFGKRSNLTRAQILEVKATKKVKVYAYDSTGKLAFVR
jgi:IS1 family transposase